MRRTRRTVLIVVSIFFLLALGLFTLLSLPQTYQFALSQFNQHSSWKISAEQLEVSFLKSRISFAHLNISHPTKQKQVKLDKVSFHVQTWPLFWGKVVLSDMKVQQLSLQLPPGNEPQHKKLPLQKLILLRRLEIKHAHIEHFLHDLGNERIILAQNLDVHFSHSLLGQSKLQVKSTEASFGLHGKLLSVAAQLHLKTNTNLQQWTEDFPYLNDLHGELEASTVRVFSNQFDMARADISYLNHRITVKPLTLEAGHNPFTLSGHIDFDKTSYQADIAIPQPFFIAQLGKENSTIDTAGELHGQLHLAGKGFQLNTLEGKANADIVYRFKSDHERPHQFTSSATWNDGKLQLAETKLTSGNGLAKIDGNIDYGRKQFNLHFTTQQFPLDSVLGLFKNVDLQKVRGKTDADGKLTGWGKNFVLNIQGTTLGGGWGPLSVEKVTSDFVLTYPKLHLKSLVWQRGKNTGEAELTVHYGKMLSDRSRDKNIELVASVNNYQLSETFSELAGLTGTAQGNFELTGHLPQFHGTGHIEGHDGMWKVLYYDHIISEIDIKPKKISLEKIRLQLPELEEQRFANPITLLLQPGKMLFQGKPQPFLDVDGSYTYASKTWQINHITYHAPERQESATLKGSIAGENAKLRLDGTLNLTLLNPFSSLLREASGNAEVNIQMSGPFSDPFFDGTVKLQHNNISPRFFDYQFEDSMGTIRFVRKQIFLDHFSSTLDDGQVRIDGNITLSELQPKSVSLDIQCTSCQYRSADSDLRLEFDGQLGMHGALPSPQLEGRLLITDGKYTKNFHLLDALKAEQKRIEARKEEAAIWFNPQLKLHIQNSGEFFIKNNVGKIGLEFDLNTSGTRIKPVFAGTVNVNEGEIRYLGLGFEITRGFMEFRTTYNQPYLEVTAEKDIGIHHINLELHGAINNLSMELAGSSGTNQPLEKRDLLFLIATGVTPQEMEELRAQGKSQFSTPMIGAQLGTTLEGPLHKLIRIDSIRLMSRANENDQTVQQLTIGKRVNERLNLGFTTDLGSDAAEQTLSTEYLITDNLLIKSNQSNRNKVGVRGAIRFRSR